MTTLTVPAVYTIKAMLRRARNASLMRAIEQVPVIIRDVCLDQAPVAIEADYQSRGRVRYRIVDGQLYGPVFSTPHMQAHQATLINCRNPFLPADFKSLLPKPNYEGVRLGGPPRLLDPVLNASTATMLDEAMLSVREVVETHREEGVADAQKAADRCVMIDGVLYQPSLGPVYSINKAGTVIVSEIDDAPSPVFIARLDEWQRLPDMIEAAIDRRPSTQLQLFQANILVSGYQTFDSDALAMVRTAAEIMDGVPDRYLYNYSFQYMELYFRYHSPGFDRDSASPELAQLLRDFAATKSRAYINGAGKDRMLDGFRQAELISRRLQLSPEPENAPRM
ncbi:hypothetical protein [Bosea sp. RAC05]|uniref:hypothetical protein n=1 Tax=Bosea sp. RAC05 TaxID=1842539 RepID=UPI00083D9614|nr:hypothetical protein [Bosea sp. RAC05]AOG03077.1 hypothetical protein BSY19_5124 [Bosea sp. RAC05]